MESTGDPAALHLRCIDRPLEQVHPVAMEVADAPRKRRRQRKLHEVEKDQPDDQRRRERPPEAVAARRHRRVALVGLEEKGLPVRPPHPAVGLEQLALVAVEAVPGLAQVADLGVGGTLLERESLVLPEVEALADQPGSSE